MSGFSGIIGFMFSFFVIAGLFSAAFFSYQQQIVEQAQLIESFETKYLQDYNFEIDFSLGYYSTEKLLIYFKNIGKQKIIFKERYNSCFDVYLNGVYIAKENFYVYINNPQDNYFILNPNQDGVIDIKTTINKTITNKIRVVSCGGVEEEFVIGPQDLNWFDNNYIRKTVFSVINSLGSDSQNQYYNIVLNSSNFDFTKSNENSINFVLPTSENKILDVRFDNYKQRLDDFSRYNHTIYLGATIASESSDPAKVDGVFYNGLNFDGSSDFCSITSVSTLQPQKEITISAWVYVYNWTGTSNYPIVQLGSSKLYIVNDGGVNQGKVRFETSQGGIYSTSTINTNSWYYLGGSYNGSIARVFINSNQDNQASISGDMTYAGSYRIGSDGATNYFKGLIDDVSVYNIALNSSEFNNLSKSKFSYKNLNYTITDWNALTQGANVSVKIPIIYRNNGNVSFDLYYYYNTGDTSSQTQDSPPAMVPAKITNLKAYSQNEQVYLTWSEPNDNGYAISSYTINYGTVASGTFGSTYVDDDIVNATITGLINDVSYQFRAFATNSEGSGPNSDTVTSTPNATFYMTSDLSTNLGVDGTANQGTTVVAKAQMISNVSTATSACIGQRSAKTNLVMAQEYTPRYGSSINIEPNVIGTIAVSGSTNPITWRARLYEYNDATGDVVLLATAQNVSLVSAANTLNLRFNNTAFTIAQNNRLKVVVDATHTLNQWAYLCYGVGTQSYFKFNRN